MTVLGGTSQMGDHLLALSASGKLALIDQLGSMIGKKNLTQTLQGYWPFGAGAHALCVGELVANTSAYEEEVVVATTTGLMWLHVSDLLGTVDERLPATGDSQGAFASGYWMEVAKGNPTGAAGTNVQPRTNRALSAAWAIARRPDATSPSGFDDKLHILDQRGAYWRVNHAGQVQLWERDRLALGTRSCGFVGSIAGASSAFLAPDPYLLVGVGPSGAVVAQTPWLALNGVDVVQQFAPQPFAESDNWQRTPLARSCLDGMLSFPHGGCVLAESSGGTSAWFWSGGEDWGNLIEGYHINGSHFVDSVWSSVAEPATVSQPMRGTNANHLRLRSHTNNIVPMSQQALRAVRLANPLPGNTVDAVLVAGCPGGRVRIVSPGNWRTGQAAAQAQGIGAIVASSDDLGFGGGAMSVRHEVVGGNETVRIWLGTLVNPSKRPASYDQNAGSLADDEVAFGAVHMLEWQRGSNQVPRLQTIPLMPAGAGDRGGYGVVGMEVADFLPNPGDELIVATVSGDLFIYNIDPTSAAMTPVTRTHVPGAIGFYNSIVVANLGGGSPKELYVSGSLGVWRFTQSGE